MNCMLKMDSIKEHTVIQAKAEGCLFCLSRRMACSLVCKITSSLFKYEYGIKYVTADSLDYRHIIRDKTQDSLNSIIRIYLYQCQQSTKYRGMKKVMFNVVHEWVNECINLLGK